MLGNPFVPRVSRRTNAFQVVPALPETCLGGLASSLGSTLGAWLRQRASSIAVRLRTHSAEMSSKLFPCVWTPDMCSLRLNAALRASSRTMAFFFNLAKSSSLAKGTSPYRPAGSSLCSLIKEALQGSNKHGSVFDTKFMKSHSGSKSKNICVGHKE